MPVYNILLLTLWIFVYSTSGVELQYEGCFVDRSTRDLPRHYSFPQTNSPQVCASHCQSLGFSVIGLQFGAACFCGNPPFGRYNQAKDEDCRTPCPGDASVKCGAAWLNSIYTISQSKSTTESRSSDMPTTSQPSAEPKTPTSTDTAVPGISLSYMGCYLDAPTRDLDVEVFDQYNSPERCAAECLSRGYSVIGLQWGESCWCGHSFGSHGRSSQWPCDEPCPGKCNTTCGGAWTNDVYEVRSGNELTPTTPGSVSSTTTMSSSSQFTYVGCFYDNTPRDLPFHYSLPGELTKELCAEKCRGYQYMGLQFGRACFCGNSYGQYNAGSGCNIECDGNKQQRCGGAWYNDVYKL